MTTHMNNIFCCLKMCHVYTSWYHVMQTVIKFVTYPIEKGILIMHDLTDLVKFSYDLLEAHIVIYVNNIYEHVMI